MLVLVIIFLRNCQGGKKSPLPGTIVKERIVTKWDTIRKNTPTYIPKVDTIIHRDTIKIPRNIDTTEILKDYFAYKYYIDTFQTDSITLLIYDTITENIIKSRNIALNILYPTITITRDSVVNNREFYMGIGIGTTLNNLNYVGAEALYRNKKRQAFGLGVGIDPTFQPVLMGKFYWKLGK